MPSTHELIERAGGKPRARKRPVAIVCAGNWLIARDRLGPRVFSMVRDRYSDDVAVFDTGSTGLALLDCLDGQQLAIIVDAAAGTGQSTAIVCRDLPVSAGADTAVSAHQIGPLDTLTLIRELYPRRLPARVTLLLVDAPGDDGEAFEEVCREVVERLDTLVARWRDEAFQPDRNRGSV
jgi:hydrogenase maturation protease